MFCERQRNPFITSYNILFYMQQLSVMVPDDVMDAILKRVKRSDTSKSIVVRELLRAGLKKPTKDDQIAEHERKYHAATESFIS